ncbi:hypothetical protein D8I35_12445 [Corticibacter populi]|uniref:TonB-dependent receptor n=2 Tax=Corticibacter populi TaxID=1550736 RepID=A0A3M6QSE7_9BURK|nr:hypothetical protein D8I35_12445 [Corticibacter populi]
MKLLDCALIGVFASMAAAASVARAQEGVPQQEQASAQPGPDVQCTDGRCQSAEGLLFKLRTRSYDQPATAGADAQAGSRALQADRRATIALDEPGKATVQGKFAIDLPGGGIIWATEDPTLGEAELTISAPSIVPFDGRRITKPVQFYLRSNYPAFVQRYELSIYRAADADLIEPLVQLPLAVAAVSQLEWDGALPARYRYRTGDELVYVLRAYDAEGNFDETYPRSLQLASPEEAERGSQLLRDSAQQALGTSLTTAEAQTQSLLATVFAENGLRQQNIGIYGSRVRIQGRNIPDGQQLYINGESYPVDLERKFVAEFLMPVGHHAFQIGLGQPGGTAGAQQVGVQRSAAGAVGMYTLNVDVTGRYFFGVALADLTISQNKHTGSSAPFANDARYDDDVISDGRLAFYGKAKLRGKYLITAQADTTERDVKKLFSGFTDADPQDIFRRLDPDLYYPTYGDDSTTYRDVDTMGRFYLRADWDKNQALWGNYSTGITGTEYAQYNRSLYGAALNWRTNSTNRWGDPVTQARAFGSEAQTAPGRSEFIGTGGSLYYLRHTDVLPGSDTVTLEVRDRTTGRVQTSVTLQRGADYEIDELQGRILLSRPLALITRENLPTLTRDVPLDGFEQRLLVDYEWVPADFDADEITLGLRGKHWFGDHVGVGATYVDENRAGEDYRLVGADVTLQAGKGTYVKIEHSRTESTSVPVWFSDNGGFDFSRTNPDGSRDGNATAVEGRVNLKEIGWTEQEWTAAAWHRKVDEGYSTGRQDTGQEITEYGAEVQGQVTDDVGVYARYSRAERGAESLTQAQLTGEWRVNDASTVSAEIRRVEEERTSGDATGTLGALKYSHRFGTALELYGIAQLTLDDDGGAYEDNDAYTLGGKYLFGNLSSVGAEVTSGDRGDAAQLNAEYRLSPEHTLYGAYTYSTDTTAYDSLFNPNNQTGWTLGQRWRLSNQVNIFNERQSLKAPDESGLQDTFGLDFYPGEGWRLGVTLTDGDLTTDGGGTVDRRAVSISAGRTSAATDWQSKIEWRRDSGFERRKQWVLTNRLTHKIDESWRIAARFNYADTDDHIDPTADARFVEGNFGFAYRPWNNQRWGLFGRYTYLYDLASLGQLGGAQYDQKSHVLSFEGVHKLDQNWELAAKLARREGKVRFGRGAGDWADSAATFAAGQIRYDLRQQWHALAEYRALKVKDGGIKKGFLVGLDRDITKNFRIGLGYNFTDFSDKLTDFDYDHKGWFINLVGTY